MSNSTIKDVALAAGVSAMTVTRVFRNDRNVSSVTRELVLAAAQELNYRPNHSARALRGGATHTIGFIASNVEFISRTLRRMSIKLMPHRYISSIIDSLGDTNVIAYGLAEVAARQMDALIFEYRAGYGELEDLMKFQKNPIVFSFLRCPDYSGDFCHIDLESAYLEALKYLVGHGRKNIYVLGRSFSFFRESFRQYGFEQNWLDTSTYPSKPDYANHAEKFIDFIEHGGKVDAIFCENEIAAARICNYLHNKKIRIPQDIAVIGLSNHSLSPHLSPPLSTIDSKDNLLGDVLYDMTMHRLQNPDAPAQKRYIKPEFILRESAMIK